MWSHAFRLSDRRLVRCADRQLPQCLHLPAASSLIDFVAWFPLSELFPCDSLVRQCPGLELSRAGWTLSLLPNPHFLALSDCGASQCGRLCGITLVLWT